MITLKVDASGVDELLRQLDSRLSNLADPIAEILEQALTDAEHTVRVTKDEWPPMAAATIKSGRDPSTLLVKSERLLESLQRGAPENIFQVDASSGIAGSSVSHAAYQQEGSDRHPARPPRPFLVWDEARIGSGPELGGTSLEIFERHLGKR